MVLKINLSFKSSANFSAAQKLMKIIYSV